MGLQQQLKFKALSTFGKAVAFFTGSLRMVCAVFLSVLFSASRLFLRLNCHSSIWTGAPFRKLAVVLVAALSSSILQAQSLDQGSQENLRNGSPSFNIYSYDFSGLPGSSSRSTLSQIGVENGKRPIVLKYKFGLSGRSFADERDQAQTAGLAIGSQVRVPLLNNLDFVGSLRVNLESGHAQSRFGDNVPRNGIYLKEAVLQSQWGEPFVVLAGAIDQSRLRLPFLFAESAFPGLMENIDWSYENSGSGLSLESVYFRAEQVIPSSVSEGTAGENAESVPWLLTEETGVQLAGPSQLRGELRAGHYRFQGLSNKVAEKSEILGNSVFESSASESNFIYEFEGWFAGLNLKWKVTPVIDLRGSTLMIQNLRAPESFRNAQLQTLGLDWKTSGGLKISPSVDTFFAESDVSPAAYSSAEFGHNNRTGWGARLAVSLDHDRLVIDTHYVDANIINSSLTQSRQQYFMIKVETPYEVL